MLNHRASETHDTTAGSCTTENKIWASAPSGSDYAESCLAGRTRAHSLISEMRAANNPSMLGHIIQAIAGSGNWGGLEVGFCQVIAEHALR